MRRRILTFLVLLTACGRPEPPRIGVVVSVQPSQAAVIAARDLAEDTPFEPWVRPGPEPIAADTALRIAELFAADPRVVGVVGHSNSAASLAASQVYNRAGLVQIAPTSTSTAYSAAGSFSFRMVPGDERQARFIADSASVGWPEVVRVAVIYVNDDYGRSFYRELRPLLRQAPMFEGVYAEMADTTHLVDLGRQIAVARPELLIWLGRPRRLRVLLQPLRATLPGLRVICGDACDDYTVYENEFGEYTGLRFVRFTDPQAAGADREAFRLAYENATGELPTTEALLTYDAVAVLAAALKAGAVSREQVRQYLVSLGRERPPVQGLAGPISFDDNGDLLRGYLLADVTDAGVVPVRTGVR